MRQTGDTGDNDEDVTCPQPVVT